MAFEQAQFFGSGREQLQSGFGAQNPRGMRLEGHRDCLGSARPRPRNDLPQHVRVGAVDSVKVAHGDERRAEVSGNFVEFVENLHES